MRTTNGRARLAMTGFAVMAAIVAGGAVVENQPPGRQAVQRRRWCCIWSVLSVT